MTPLKGMEGVQQAYNFWLGLMPQFLGRFGGGHAVPGANGDATGTAAPLLNGLTFPADQIAKSAALTQQMLQSFAQMFAPLLASGAVPNLFDQWASAMPGFAANKPGDAAAAATTAAQSLYAPWAALMKNVAGAIPAAVSLASNPAGSGAASSVLPLQAIHQAWTDLGSGLTGATPEQLRTAFDRTYGGLGDALGLSVGRELYEAWQVMLSASVEHQEARANYSVLVQSAFAQGVQRLTTRLAERASKGERIDSVLALLRLWAMATEEVIHETLQSQAGLATSAALMRSASTYRKRMQHVSAVLAGLFDLTSRSELDEAFREIQGLKRELRALRPPRGPERAAPVQSRAAPVRSRKPRTSAKGKRRASEQ